MGLIPLRFSPQQGRRNKEDAAWRAGCNGQKLIRRPPATLRRGKVQSRKIQRAIPEGCPGPACRRFANQLNDSGQAAFTINQS
jgi:hypothetical protein